MLDFLFYAFVIACISFTYHVVLRDFLLCKWFLFGYNHFGRHEGTWREYIYMPIWGCEKCFSGQCALWSFLFLFDYNFMLHIGFISVSITLTSLLSKWNN